MLFIFLKGIKRTFNTLLWMDDADDDGGGGEEKYL
jgi:hypothetical protein